MTKTEGGGGKHVGDARIDIFIVAGIWSNLSDQPRQEIFVAYLLDLRAYHRPGSEIDSIIVERRLAAFETICLEIMLAHEEGLQRGEGAVFVHPHIAAEEKSGAGIGLVREPVHIERQEVTGADFQVASPVQRPQLLRAGIIRSINL